MREQNRPQVTPPLPVTAWSEVISSECLEGFLPAGGSAVRFASGNAETLALARESLSELARSKGFHFVELDPSELNEDGKKPDFHRIDRVFFRIAETIDWRQAAGKQILEALESRGVMFPDGRVSSDYHAVAKLNGLESSDLLNKYERMITELVLRDLGMAVEFRVAITALGRAQLIPEEITPTTEELLLGWLRGEKPLPGGAATLKRIRIHERIGRSNARFMLQSLLHWLKRTGKSGVVLLLDFRPYESVQISRTQRTQMQYTALLDAIERGASNEELRAIKEDHVNNAEGVRYGKSAYIQALELLRHFIDEIEQMEGLLLVVLGSQQFFDERPSLSGFERRFTDYNALQTRIGLEVHDVEKQNPSAALVHLGGD